MDKHAPLAPRRSLSIAFVATSPPRQCGIVVPFRSESALADATVRILRDPALKRSFEHAAYAYGRETAWPRVGQRTLAILRNAVSATHIGAPAMATVSGA